MVKSHREGDQGVNGGWAVDRTVLFTEHRRYLFAVAYRMLGIAEDAEDILQEAWIRFSGVRVEELEHPRTYLVTIVTRLCVDLLRSARRRREEYVGVWLPEPVRTPEALANDMVEEAESASFAFLLLLECLSPVQRAVLVLHDVFDYSHDEVAEAIGRTPAASRQALSRARQRLGHASRPKSSPTEEALKVVRQFVEATRSGDLKQLMGTLAPEVVLMSDGGGQVPAVKRPLAGSERVGRFFSARDRLGPGSQAQLTELNAQPAILVTEDGILTKAYLFDITAAGVTAIYAVRNPDKLKRLAS